MSHKTESKNADGTSISLSIPVSDPGLFKHKATSDVLLFLTNNRFEEYSLRGIADQIGHAQQTVRRATDTLVENGLAVETREGNRRLVRINRSRLSVPDDPYLRIPQSEFHEPVKAAVDELKTRLDGVVGIVLYGSVARGEADSRSDIDLWALVRKNRAENQREANAISRQLEDDTFDGNRYFYDVDVEAVRAVPTYTEDVREIVVSGIALYKTGDFETVENLLEEGVDDE